YISIVFKNISEYQVDFTEEEILERFKRGDSSRTTEGSGLGLSIAKSLVELRGGQFIINIDGDLFKVVVNLKKA
ncbi:sensor histidine kinase, partial [Clostridium botulinum]|nr:sensor histidine kinase [Clostridium botulinum]